MLCNVYRIRASHFPAISFSISSTPRGSWRVSNSLLSGVMRISSSIGLNDSKQLTRLQRENFFAFLTNCGEVEFAVAQIDAAQIDAVNILQATHRAMNDALAQSNPEHALVDGRAVKTMRVPQTAIIKGDARSYSIAAASVLAKVTRDRLMLEFDRRWPVYGFAAHKGYGTPQHLAALAAHGPCPIHRRSFAPLKPQEPKFL